jgi:uncharacterized membrane protein (UPF0182 family)
VIVITFVIFTGYYTDLLWFESVDKTEVFTTQIVTRAIMFVGFGGLMVGGIVAVMWWAWRTRPTFRGMTPEQASLERYRDSIEPYRVRLMLAVALVMGLLAGLTASGEWGSYLLWRNATPFGINDPQFGLDLSFYTFTLPFIRFLLGFGFALLFIAIIAAVVIQYLYGGLRLQPKGDRASKGAQIQLSVLIALLLLLKAVSYWYDRFGLAIKSESLLGGRYVQLSPGGDPDEIRPGGRIQFVQNPVDLEDLIGRFMFSSQGSSSAPPADGATRTP